MKKFYSCFVTFIIATTFVGQAASRPGDYVPEFSDILGYYDWEYLPEDWGPTVSKRVTFEAGEKENDIIITGMWGDSEIKAVYDPSMGYVTIPDQPVEKDGSVWLRSAHYDNFAWEIEEAWELAPSVPYRCFTIPNGLMFDSMEYTFGFFDDKGKLLKGAISCAWFTLVNMDEEFWSVFDQEATYTDAWYGATAPYLSTPYKVTVLQNKANPYLLAIADPYGAQSPIYRDNLDTEAHGYIVFDVEEPTCVRVKQRVYSGLTATVEVSDPYDGVKEMEFEFYNYNIEEDMCITRGITSKEAASQLLAGGSNVSHVDGNEVVFENCLVGHQNNRYAGYTYGGTGVLTCSKSIPGEEAGSMITLGSSSTAPVEYYTLQGIKVLQPQKGNIYIERKGSEVKKIKF